MMDYTSFFYLKTLERQKTYDSKFDHVLFHLYRYVSIYSTIKWERVFFFSVEPDQEFFKDASGKKTLRHLTHHHLVEYETNQMTPQGKAWLRRKEEEWQELNDLVEAFFEQYTGNTAYTNSCYAQAKGFTMCCHFCTNHICQQEEKPSVLLSLIKKPLFKSPYRSFSA